MQNNIFRSRGAALFVSVLMTFSLSIIALATMSRLSEVAHTRAGDYDERRLQIYAFSAMNIVNGELRQLLDSTLDFADAYSIGGGDGASTAVVNRDFKYYPRDNIGANGGVDPSFAYRAVARKLTTSGSSMLYGINKYTFKTKGGDACYDIMVDVRIVNVHSQGRIAVDPEDINEVGNKAYVLGKMKTVGQISCFTKGEINYTGND